jgi:hypothetical protein
MHRLIPFDSSSQDAVPGLAALAPVPAADAAMAAPDARWAILGAEGAAAACCSLWWTDVAQLAGKRLGVIGHYAARDPDSAVALLNHVCRELQSRACTTAVGPMDGTTWRRYRFVTDRGAEPTFFLEPDNRDEYPAHWAAAGFTPLASYSSAVNERIGAPDPAAERADRRFVDSGLRFRPLDPARLEHELRRIHRLSLLSFRDNYLYSPIGEDEFLKRYLPLAPLLRPPLIVMAEDPADDILAGYMFAVPDYNEQKRGQPLRSIVAKTIARVPGDKYSGLGAVMMARCYRAAVESGFARAYSALMHQDNPSRKLFAEHLRPVRRYTLFARELHA